MNKLEKQLQEGRMLAKLPQWVAKYSKAIRDIRLMLAQSPESYVTLSWGKQSIILAHMVFSVRPSVPCVHWSNPNAELFADFAATRDKFIERWSLNYIEFPDGDTDLKGNGKRYMQQNGMTGVFMGLAAEESKGRQYTLKGGHETLRQYKDRTWRCCPLAAWETHDLAAYIASYDLPLLSPYRRYGLETRTSTGATKGSHSERGLDFLKSTQLEDLK